MKKIFLTTLILCQAVFHSFSQDSIAKQYAELITPVELKDNALYPVAVFEPPVVLLINALDPTAVLALAVVFSLSA